MILCFGTFGRVLNCCRHGISMSRFVARVAWVVDTKNRCLGAGLDYEIDDNALDTIKNLSNPPVASRLLSCKQDFELNGNKEPPVDVSFKRFKSKVMPFINEDMVAKAVLTVRYIISLDDTIGNERKETFKKYLGMYRDEFLQQTIFDVPDFFTRVLLYTTCVDNNEGRPYVKKITDTLIEGIANDDWAELRWDTITQTLELVPAGERRLSDWVDQLCQLRSPIAEDVEGFVNMEWIGVNMTDLDPSIWGRTEIRKSDAQRLLSRKINPYVQTQSPGHLETSSKLRRWFRGKSNKSSEDM